MENEGKNVLKKLLICVTETKSTKTFNILSTLNHRLKTKQKKNKRKPNKQTHNQSDKVTQTKTSDSYVDRKKKRKKERKKEKVFSALKAVYRL